MAALKPLVDALPGASGMKTSNRCCCTRLDGGGSCDKLAMSHMRASFLLLRSSCTQTFVDRWAIWEDVQASGNLEAVGIGGGSHFLHHTKQVSVRRARAAERTGSPKGSDALVFQAVQRAVVSGLLSFHLQ